jgi:hypothetical protein
MESILHGNAPRSVPTAGEVDPMQPVLATIFVCFCAQASPPYEELDVEVELRGSPESMDRQHRVASDADFTFVGTLEEMELLAEAGHLVPIAGGRDYEVMDWVFPYAVPEVRTFVERFASQYRRTCGEQLVVTSLTRPLSEQPPNAHELSVHPAGMAVDLRVPQNPACRQFLETALLQKEAAGLLDVTLERSPPHYHIAIFPEPYGAFVQAQGDDGAITLQRGADTPLRGRALALAVIAVAVAGAAAVGAWLARRRRRQARR